MLFLFFFIQAPTSFSMATDSSGISPLALGPTYWNLKEYDKNAFFFFNPYAADCYPLPDEKDTVVEIYLKEE